MGYTPGLLRGEQKCPGRSVTRWMNGSSSSPGCWMGRRWRCCAVSSASRARPATRLTRYNEIGLEGLTDRSRRPYRHANQLPFQIETQIVRLKQDRPSWGAPKIREKLARLYPDVPTPAISTVHAVLDLHGLVKRRMGRRNRARERRFPFPASPMICGAPTTRASSCSPTDAIAIR